MKRIFVVAATLMLACATSFAQMNFNLAYVNSVETTKINSNKYTSPLNGFTAGLGYSLELADDFYFTPGVNYLFLSGTGADSIGGLLSLKGDVQEHYINIPMTLSYDYEISRGTKVFVFAGPTASIGLASTTTLTATVLGYSSGSKVDNYEDGDYKRFDIMLGGGAGVKIADKYCVKAGYDWGLLNRTSLSNTTDHRGQLTVGVAYIF